MEASLLKRPYLVGIVVAFALVAGLELMTGSRAQTTTQPSENAMVTVRLMTPQGTLSEPVQIRIGILNQLSPEQINEIVSRFADAMIEMGAPVDKAQVLSGLKKYYAQAA